MIQTIFARLFIILQCVIVVCSIYVTLNPASQSVFRGGNVEFKCNLFNIEGFTLVWLIDYDQNDDGLLKSIYAEQTVPSKHEEDGHGTRSVQYTTELDAAGNQIHNLIFRINNVQLIDEGRFSCGYETLSGKPIPLSKWAVLTILEPPIDSNPRCSFLPTVISPPTTLTLICEISGGKPAPELIWHRANSSISSKSIVRNDLQYEITANDNGIQFICVANGPALSTGGSLPAALCSVTPLNISPSVLITYSTMPFVENSDIIFTCASSGLPSISQLDWFYKGRLLSDDLSAFIFRIIDLSDTTSELHLFDVQLSDNNSEVKCKVQIPSGLTNEEAVLISIIPAAVPPVTTPKLELTTLTTRKPDFTEIINDPAASVGLTTSTLIPISAAASGLVLILVIAIIVTIIYRRHQHDKQRARENSPLELDIPCDNTYKMGGLSNNNKSQSPTRSTRHDSVGYVINQISSVNNSPAAQRSVTMGSDHPYDPVNIANQPAATRAPKSTPSASQPSETSPYANIFLGKEENVSYADLDLSHVPQSDIIHGNPPSSPVHYSEIEGEL